jgi:dipeptidyl aminopeptidase/acylaminoacyl peptidase
VSAFDLSVDDTLDLVQISDPAWNADGTRVGFLRFADGDTAFAARSVGAVERTAVSLRDGSFDPETLPDLPSVASFEWRPGHPDEALVVADGDLYRVDVTDGEPTAFASAADAHGSPAWHPDGDRVAYLRDRTLWIHGLDGELRAVPLDAPVRPADLFGPTPLAWSPDGRYVAMVVETDDETLGVAAVDTRADELAWATTPASADDCLRADFAWVGPDHLVYAEDSADGARRVYRSVRLGEDAGASGAGEDAGASGAGEDAGASGAGEDAGASDAGSTAADAEGVAVASESVDGLLLPHSPVGHESGRLAVVSARTGYRHVYAIDVDRRRAALEDEGAPARPGLQGEGVVQVTSGEFEARGDAGDVPDWSPDGDRLAYVTNEVDPGERHLEVATLADGAVVDRTRFDDVRGNAIGPTWGPDGDRVACLRSGRFSPTDVHVASLETGGMARVTASHPAPERFDELPEPEPVSFEASDGATVYGYLYVPPGASTGDEVPSVVLCHGGPISQMRRGFHHGRTYGYFHLFDQYFVSEGYAVLELNFRSGVGYGDDFEQAIHRNVGVVEVDDCVAAADYLRERPETSDAVGMWGRSYGGFLANALATMTDAYDCAVNVAGIWNWRTWEEWAVDLGPTHWGAGEPSWFHNRFGGPPDSDDPEVQARYDRASPSEYVDDLDTPLLSLHGSTDKNVTVGELEELIADCVDAGVDFDAVYYPDEEHMFEQPATWRDALGRVTDFFGTHLRDHE